MPSELYQELFVSEFLNSSISSKHKVTPDDKLQFQENICVKWKILNAVCNYKASPFSRCCIRKAF